MIDSSTREPEEVALHGQDADMPSPNSLADILQELRILLQGAQVLTAFLTILPFNSGFDRLDETERWIFLVTFMCSLTSLIFFAAPAAMHRLMRPVVDRTRYKDFITRLMIIGLVPASVALVLSSQIVTSVVIGEPLSWVVAVIVAVIIGLLWWAIPIIRRDEL